MKLNYDEFDKVIFEEVEKALQERYGYGMERVSIIEDGVAKDGMRVTMGNNATAPLMDMAHSYQKFCAADEPVEEFVEQVVNMFVKAIDAILQANGDLELCNIKEQLYLQVLNVERNKELLKKFPYDTFLDLAVIVRWKFSDHGSMPITHKMLENLGVSKEELFEIAKENISNFCEPVLLPMSALFEDIASESAMDRNIPDELLASTHMWMLTNEENHHGAHMMLHDAILSATANLFEGDFYILPSSIHELILIPACCADLADLMDLVETVNTTALPEEDYLSDSVYFYSREEGKVMICELPINNNIIPFVKKEEK